MKVANVFLPVSAAISSPLSLSPATSILAAGLVLLIGFAVGRASTHLLGRSSCQRHRCRFASLNRLWKSLRSRALTHACTTTHRVSCLLVGSNPASKPHQLPEALPRNSSACPGTWPFGRNLQICNFESTIRFIVPRSSAGFFVN